MCNTPCVARTKLKVMFAECLGETLNYSDLLFTIIVRGGKDNIDYSIQMKIAEKFQFNAFDHF